MLSCQHSSFRCLWLFNYLHHSTAPGCASSKHHWKFIVNYNQQHTFSTLWIWITFFIPRTVTNSPDNGSNFPFQNSGFFFLFVPWKEKKIWWNSFLSAEGVIFPVMIIEIGLYFRMSILIFYAVWNLFVNLFNHLNNSGNYIFDINVEREI